MLGRRMPITSDRISARIMAWARGFRICQSAPSPDRAKRPWNSDRMEVTMKWRNRHSALIMPEADAKGRILFQS